MKKRNVIAGLLLTFMFSAILASAVELPKNEKITYKMPHKVKAVFENKCFGCHNNESRSDKAKDKLNFDKLSDLTKVEKLGTFNHVKKVLDEGKMPPKKFLERYPEKGLTAGESKLLNDWVQKESKSLLKD
ncbi:MAG TPA: heme-binding domain-containing protein [Sunxiuqinia sp.]|nr:heme-binding domain-containing protein [Sunxiuqinia sp.]